ncbi:MAG: cyclopropane-fatty-acyl-phospholipid synthase family protein [Pirellulaceae bacterium]|nr:cyclopropane-fatty-acyl-phospholipid synthase family protein [Pirellulaceae bacterium]
MEIATTCSPSLSWPDRCWRNLVLGRLAGLSRGALVIHDAGERMTLGDPAADLAATIEVHDRRFYRRVALGGDLGAAESLLDGDWSCDELPALVRIFIRNLEATDRLAGWLNLLRQPALWWWRLRRRNTRRGAARNIHDHYDLGNDFFSLFLDDTLCYSCGIYADSQTSLRDASLAKLDRVCRQLDLRPTDHLLEIGSGWGGLAIHAAAHFGCRVTTATISREQQKLATQRIRAAGLADKVEVVLSDYRDLTGQYDKLASIEMIEAVGHENLPTFFRQCGRLLRPNGLMLLQAIVIQDQRYRRHIRGTDFISRHVFPGGCLPSVEALVGAMARGSDLAVRELADFGPHYGETLRRWRAAFHNRLAEVRSQGFDQRFIRLWDYYLAYCEAAFDERQVSVVQMRMARPERGEPMLISAGSR